MHAKVSKISKNDLLFEALTTKPIKNKIAPTGEGRIGTVVMDSQNNLIITEEALPLLQQLFDGAKCDGSGFGDIDWFKSDDGKWNFSWLGPLKRVISVTEECWKAKDSNCEEAIALKQFLEE